MASATMKTTEARIAAQPQPLGNDAMKLLCCGATVMIIMAGVIAEQEVTTVSPLTVFFMAGVGGTFTSLATYLLAGKKNDSHSLAAHMLGNIGIACSIGGMVAMHGAPMVTGIPGTDVFQIVFVGGLLGISGMALIGAVRGMLTVQSMQSMAARAFGLEVPDKHRKKAMPPGADDTDS